jgi:RNA polymerase sigma factor (sigma-70 family)
MFMPYYSEATDLSFTPLSRDDEAALFKVYHSRTSNSLRARNRIIRHYLKFTAKTAIACAKGALDEDDAISAGNFGLMQALKTRRFNPARGPRFSGYLRKFIRGQVFESLKKGQRLGKSAFSYHDEYGEGAVVTGRAHLTGSTWNRDYADMKLEVDEGYENRQLNSVRRESILHAARMLTTAERRIIRHELDGKTQTETAKAMKVKRQAVGNLRMRALRKLRGALAAQKHDLL